MINLLPPEIKSGYRYARRNVSLRKWVAVFVVALIGLGAITTYGLLTMKQATLHYNNQIASSQSLLKKEDFDGTQKKVQDISNNFKLVVQVLKQEILFSQLLQQMGTAIPAKASLTGLNISQVTGGIDISAVANDYNTATQIQINLADPANKIFTKADISSLTCNPKDTAQTKAIYPCTVNIRALFADNNPFLFINSQGATKK